jgi:hypothetical protein
MNPVTTTNDPAGAASRTRPGRAALWIGFAITGLLLGSVWATGFSVSNASNGADNASVRVDGTPHANANIASPYASAMTNPEDLTVDWNGFWGVVAADTAMYKVDLSGVAAGTYYAEVLVKSTDTDWDSQQYKFELFEDAATCDAATALPQSTDPEFVEAINMNVTTEDSYVSFDGLANGHVYCIGLRTIDPASDETGTFLRRPNDASFPTATTFTGLVNRSA